MTLLYSKVAYCKFIRGTNEVRDANFVEFCFLLPVTILSNNKFTCTYFIAVVVVPMVRSRPSAF